MIVLDAVCCPLSKGKSSAQELLALRELQRGVSPCRSRLLFLTVKTPFALLLSTFRAEHVPMLGELRIESEGRRERRQRKEQVAACPTYKH